MTPREPTEVHRREREEPVEHFQPIPLSYLFFVGVLTVIGFVYMVRFAGDEGLQGDMRTASALAPVAPASSAASGGAAAADGGQIYASLCVACHQASGLGLPGVFPPLAGSEWLKGAPELSIKILLLGMGGSVTVKGVAYNGQMPAFKQLSDAEIAAVLTHVRAAWQNGGAAVTADAVKQARKALQDRSEPWKGEAELGRPQ
ncbi:MAG TPA: cytochrome c [Ideonella sp.]|nr:cytochrome c [Ideonella sp.]